MVQGIPGLSHQSMHEFLKQEHNILQSESTVKFLQPLLTSVSRRSESGVTNYLG